MQNRQENIIMLLQCIACKADHEGSKAYIPHWTSPKSKQQENRVRESKWLLCKIYNNVLGATAQLSADDDETLLLMFFADDNETLLLRFFADGGGLPLGLSANGGGSLRLWLLESEVEPFS